MFAIESEEADAQLVANLFERAASRDLCSPASFEHGFQQVAEMLDDIAIYAPMAFSLMATMMKGARLDEERSSRLSSRLMHGDRLLSLLTSDVPQSRIDSPSSSRSTSVTDCEDSITASPPQNVLIPPMPDSDAYTLVCDATKELFSLLDLRAEAYFTRLPVDYHWCLVDKLVSAAIANEFDAQLVAGLFDRAAARRLCSPASFEGGFAPVIQALDHTVINAPRVFERMAIMLKSARLDEERSVRLASRSKDGDELLSWLCFHVALSSMRSRSSSSRTSSANDAKVSPPHNESSPHMSDSEAYAMVCDNAQELLSLFDLRANTYFTRLPVDHHWCLVDKLVSAAIANESDAQLVAGLFDRAAARRLCSPASFEAGLAPIAQALEHITIGAPNALECIAIMMKGAHIHEDNERCIRLANRSRRGSMLLSLLSA
ncbi:hypothetical protein A0H81_10315 [Grifola frondosa]|uniref:MI domain-containing protein n=1 Tax=Grifola frondosa TaxID=5627 RepID=A0A1C7M067_GRIFR|nr:hypothetical protein A0H81_10315 [Grifola frondosa]